MNTRQIPLSELSNLPPTFPQAIAFGNLQVVLTHNGEVLGFLVQRAVAEKLFPGEWRGSQLWRSFKHETAEELKAVFEGMDYLVVRSPGMGAIAFVPPGCQDRLDLPVIGDPDR